MNPALKLNWIKIRGYYGVKCRQQARLFETPSNNHMEKMDFLNFEVEDPKGIDLISYTSARKQVGKWNTSLLKLGPEGSPTKP